jgi:hypothetical protein
MCPRVLTSRRGVQGADADLDSWTLDTQPVSPPYEMFVIFLVFRAVMLPGPAGCSPHGVLVAHPLPQRLAHLCLVVVAHLRLTAGGMHLKLWC